ncbi:hypothetical protein Nepgr_027894 [Nepenthes gracilis]|uniref:Uncharacterized protein n=1 Tax=Nepenthes gracilis TaxID=150966 RepID=A0AAD3TBC3_NEPGR|nr:hypothetical protein Nepgr_027894 [Nepenthes gracilis]
MFTHGSYLLWESEVANSFFRWTKTTSLQHITNFFLGSCSEVHLKSLALSLPDFYVLQAAVVADVSLTFIIVFFNLLLMQFFVFLLLYESSHLNLSIISQEACTELIALWSEGFCFVVNSEFLESLKAPYLFLGVEVRAPTATAAARPLPPPFVLPARV